jgi:hypothetical protein
MKTAGLGFLGRISVSVATTGVGEGFSVKYQ